MFIAIEGGDGAGKTGVASALVQSFQAGPFAGRAVVSTREPGGTPEGLALRGLLLADSAPNWQPEAELLLMLAARVQHVARVIRPALAAGKIVICDRFIGSTLAYQGGGRALDRAMITALHGATTGDLWPDLTVLLDVEPATGLARSRARLKTAPGADESRFERLDPAFHQRVRAAYLEQAAGDAGWLVIDANGLQAAVLRSVVEAVQRRVAREA